MAEFSWKVNQYGDWSDANNWQNGAVPTATDSVDVAGNESEVIVTTSISCASIDSAGDILFQHAGPADISGDVVTQATFVVNGTDVTIGGTLYNTDEHNGSYNYCAVKSVFPANSPARLTVGAIDNSGNLVVAGKQCVLDVQGPASFGTAGTLTGQVHVGRGGLIEFSGTDQITTIASGASLLFGATRAFIADAGIDTASNSALIGLHSIDGRLQLDAGAEIDTSGSMEVGTGGSILLGNLRGTGGKLTMQGTLVNQGTIGGITKALLGIGGNLVNEGDLSIRGAHSRIDVAGRMTVASDGTVELRGGIDLAVRRSLVNDGSMTLGSPKADQKQGLLNVDGAIVNDGTMTFYGGPQEFTGAVKGDGSFSLGRDATLTFDDAVGRTAQFVLSHRDVLELADPADFHASIQGFGADDAYSIDGFDAKTKYDFVSNAAGTGGVLDVSDGAMGSAHIHMKGAYDNADFALTSDAHGVRITSTR